MEHLLEFEHLNGFIGADQLQLAGIESATLRTVLQTVAMKPHRHVFMEVIFCLRGELVYDVAGCHRFVLSAGKGIVIPPFTQHSLVGGKEAPSERIGLHLSGKCHTVRTFGVFAPKTLAHFRSILKAQANHTFHFSPGLMRDLRELAHFLKFSQHAVEPDAMGQVRLLCSSILRETTIILSNPQKDMEPRLMDEATHFIETHFAESLDIAALVKYMGYSRTTLFTLFKRHTGLTPNDYLTRYRIRKVEEFLKDSSLNMCTIATRTGFTDVAYLGSVFKRYVGLTPGQYRKHCRDHV